jgi:hypothetical protein
VGKKSCSRFPALKNKQNIGKKLQVSK